MENKNKTKVDITVEEDNKELTDKQFILIMLLWITFATVCALVFTYQVELFIQYTNR